MFSSIKYVSIPSLPAELLSKGAISEFLNFLTHGCGVLGMRLQY